MEVEQGKTKGTNPMSNMFNETWREDLQKLNEPATAPPVSEKMIAPAPVIAPVPVPVAAPEPAHSASTVQEQVTHSASTVPPIAEVTETRGGHNKIYASDADRQKAYRSRQKVKAQIDLIAQRAGEIVFAELRKQQSSKPIEMETIMNEPTKETAPSVTPETVLPVREQSMPLELLAGLMEAGNTVTPPAPVPPAPQPKQITSIDDVVDAETEKQYLTYMSSPQYEIDHAAQEKVVADAEREKARVRREEDKATYQRKWESETAALLAAREPHPMELTRHEKLRIQIDRENNKEFYEEWKRNWNL